MKKSKRKKEIPAPPAPAGLAGTWQDAIKKALANKKPPGGWPKQKPKKG